MRQSALVNDNPEQEDQVPMDQDQLLDRVHALEVAQAGQAATLAGAQATQAATHAGTMATMVTGSVSLIVGIMLGIAIGRSKS